MIDSHCHLMDKGFERPVDELVREANSSGVKTMIVCGTNLESSKKAVEIANRFPDVWTGVGIHPEEVFGIRHDLRAVNELNEYINNEKVVAIGEIGLDWWWTEHSFSPANVLPAEPARAENREMQKEVFRYQLKLAQEASLPVVIHNREADEDTISILKEYQRVKGVMHCFSQGEEYLIEALKMGFYVSFAGNITFKKNKGLRRVLKLVPLDRLFLETDAPYLTPEPMRGKWPNTPANVKLIYERVAVELGVSVEEMNEQIEKNVKKLFTNIA